MCGVLSPLTMLRALFILLCGAWVGHGTSEIPALRDDTTCSVPESEWLDSSGVGSMTQN